MEKNGQPAGPVIQENEKPEETPGAESAGSGGDEACRTELEEMKDRYVRLYADFENYRKKALRDRDEAVRYAHESIMAELLPVIDTFEMALKHASEAGPDTAAALQTGVENTRREFLRVLEKFGLKAIEAVNQEFDPAFHHAMSQVETDQVEGNRVVEEFRRGYLYRDKVLRPAYVVVSKQPQT